MAERFDLRGEAKRFVRAAAKLQNEVEKLKNRVAKLKRKNGKLNEELKKLRMAQLLGLKKNKSLAMKARTSISFEEDILKRLQKLAFSRGKSVSSLVNEFCKQALKNEPKQ